LGEVGKTIIFELIIQNNFTVSKFLYFGGYRKVSNKKVHALGDLALFINLLIIILFILFFVKTGGRGLHFTL